MRGPYAQLGLELRADGGPFGQLRTHTPSVSPCGNTPAPRRPATPRSPGTRPAAARREGHDPAGGAPQGVPGGADTPASDRAADASTARAHPGGFPDANDALRPFLAA
ncbi:hypothetical protein [Streptomyces melanogenes]|uniref:hypothetical protein n=1 Tax=Streptomyces melanogenes TaxID=67326 RepID=UPI00378821B9